MRVLVTGGAGFIGSHLVDALLVRGRAVRVFDTLEPDVHGPDARPVLVPPEAEFVRGDVRDADALWRAVRDADAVVHLAAAVGVGQSMVDIVKFTEVNTLGTAILLELLTRRRHRVGKVVVASSMSVYGEGAYRCRACGPVHPGPRDPARLARGQWEMPCPLCGADTEPLPIPETKPLRPISVYGMTKRDQEELALIVGRASGLPVTALRFFGVYGPRQSLANPYSGIVAIFIARILHGDPPPVFEDGLEQRDFVHVRDVVQACLLALERPETDHQAFNVGTGVGTSILHLAELLCQTLGATVRPELCGRYRVGDVRHGIADIGRLRALGYLPRVALADGLQELVAWARTHPQLGALLDRHARQRDVALARGVPV